MNKNGNPHWWTKEHDSGWERVKAAMRRDWDQTKHDFGGDEPDTDQDVDDTVAQAAGKRAIPPRGTPTYDDVEPAYRFGYGSRHHYGEQFTEWDADVESKLREDWRTSNPDGDANWDRIRSAVRRGWEYDERGNRAAKQPAGRKMQ
jgi:hypothetical protein